MLTWRQSPLPLLLDKGLQFPSARADILESPTGLEEQAPVCLRKVGGQESGGGAGGVGSDTGSRPSWPLRDSLETSRRGEHSWCNCAEPGDSRDVI